MKHFRFEKMMIAMGISLFLSSVVIAQDEEEKSSPLSAGTDIVSTYVWRGTWYTGPAIQPYVDLTLGGFSIGAWGSQGFDGFQEMDLYAAYSFDFGLSLGVTDYYYTGTQYFDVSDTSGAHAVEANIGYEIKGFSISANYIFNEAGGAGSAGSDLYFELGYSIGNFGAFVGAGDGWHTTDGKFNVCNIGVTASKDIEITDKFTLPLSGSAILNPQTEQYYVILGLSF